MAGALAVVSEGGPGSATFVVRADALTALKRWPVMLTMAEEATNAPASLRAHRARRQNLGRPGECRRMRAPRCGGHLAECLRAVNR